MSAISLRTPEVIDDAAAMADPESLAITDRDAPAMADRDAAAMADRLPVLTPVLRSYLRRLVPLDDVDDVVQVVFLELWRTRVRYDPARSLEAWALSIARRRAIDHLRARPRPAAPLGELAEPPGEDGRLTGPVQRAGLRQDLTAGDRRAPERAHRNDQGSHGARAARGAPDADVRGA